MRYISKTNGVRKRKGTEIHIRYCSTRRSWAINQMSFNVQGWSPDAFKYGYIFSHLKGHIITKITCFSPLQHTYCMAKQFCNVIWEKGSGKGMWTGEQEMREREENYVVTNWITKYYKRAIIKTYERGRKCSTLEGNKKCTKKFNLKT